MNKKNGEKQNGKINSLKEKTESAYQIKKDTLDMGPTKYIIKELNEEVLVLIQTELDIPYESSLNFRRKE